MKSIVAKILKATVVTLYHHPRYNLTRAEILCRTLAAATWQRPLSIGEGGRSGGRRMREEEWKREALSKGK